MSSTHRAVEEQIRAWSEALEHESREPDLVSPMPSARPVRRPLTLAASMVAIAGIGGLMWMLGSSKGNRPASDSTHVAGASIQAPASLAPGESNVSDTHDPTTGDRAASPLAPVSSHSSTAPQEGQTGCSPVERFEEFRDVVLSGELALQAESITEALRGIPGVRAVMFAADGTPTVIVAPDARPPALEFEVLVSCVSDQDIRAVNDAVAAIPISGDGFASAGYEPFSDAIQVVSNLPSDIVRAALPSNLSDRQLTVVEQPGGGARDVSSISQAASPNQHEPPTQITPM